MHQSEITPQIAWGTKMWFYTWQGIPSWMSWQKKVAIWEARRYPINCRCAVSGFTTEKVDGKEVKKYKFAGSVLAKEDLVWLEYPWMPEDLKPIYVEHRRAHPGLKAEASAWVSAWRIVGRNEFLCSERERMERSQDQIAQLVAEWNMPRKNCVLNW